MTAPLDERLRRVLLPLPAAWAPTPLRRAAVLAPIFARGGEDWLLLLVRRRDLREHAGQIAFPGGAADAGDAGPVACALREAREEVSLAADALALLGSLPPRRSSSGFCVHCIVARAPDPAGLRADPGEVERLLPIPLRELSDPGRWSERAPPRPDGRPYPPSPHFAWHDDLVWGLTGRFAHDLVSRLRAD